MQLLLPAALLLCCLYASSAATAATAPGRFGMLLGWDNAGNTHYYDNRTETRDIDIVCGAVYRPRGRWYAEIAAGWRMTDRLTGTADGELSKREPAGHLRLGAAYRADTFNRTEINLVSSFEIAGERWYDDSLYVKPLHKTGRSAGIVDIVADQPYTLSYAYSVFIPKFFIGIEPNIALNGHLRAVLRYGFELRFLPAERRLEFDTASGSLNSDDFEGTPQGNAHTELGRRLTINLQYLF